LSSTAPDASPDKPKSRWADLLPRIASALVIIVVIATALYFGGWVFAALMGLVFAVIYREWERMVTLKPLTPYGVALTAVLALAPLAYPLYGYLGVLSVMGVGFVAALFGGRALVPWRAGGMLFFAAVMVGVLGMRGETPAGILAGWFLGLVIAFNDTGAFFAGRIIGGPKLAPTISPAKTWSGAIGGWLAGILAGTLFWIAFTTSPWWIGLLLAASMGVIGQVGDLTESAIKRLFRIKDSGDVIPGHGGFMDRLDSVSFGALFLAIVGALHGGVGAVASGFLNW
jgi:phosphatidate cytidylyltransferase